MEVKKRKYCLARISALLLLLIGGWVRAESVTVSAAISLKESLAEIAKAYEKQTGDSVAVNVGASGQLMDQVKNGAPVDLFLSAAPGQVEELERAGMVAKGSSKVIARNELVLIVPAGRDALAGFEDLAKERVRRIAVGKPKAVPAGDYAAEVFEHLKMTHAVRPKLVYGANVRQVLDYVRRGEVDAGVVYATDAKEAGEAVRVVATAPADAHRPIEYVGAVIQDARHATAAGKFLNYLIGADAGKVLEAKGFVVAPKAK